MPNYTVYLTKRAQKQLDLFSNTIAYPIITAISQLEFDPRPIGYKKLKGREAYRIRVGNYRIIYEIVDFELIVTIITLGHRKDIYNP